MNLDQYLATLPVGGQVELASRIGISPAYLYQIGAGIRPVPPARCIAIAEATDWMVRPFDLRPDLYPNESDGMPVCEQPPQPISAPASGESEAAA